jgi:4-carboxymuconolactone decarboxylase
MMQGHLSIALHIGITESGLKQILSLIESDGGKKEADAGRKVLSTVLTSRGR